jgi:hypothetical protein
MMLFSKDFWGMAFERMVKTIAQVMIATITASTFIPTAGDAWVNVLVTSGLAGLVSVLTSLTSYDAVSKTFAVSADEDAKKITDQMMAQAAGPDAPQPAPALVADELPPVK